jgi:hypothetical protein
MSKRKSKDMDENIAFLSDIEKLIPKLMDDKYAKNFYRALCNMRWKKYGYPKSYSCSFRYAGGLVARLRDRGETYMDFYLSGDEGKVTEEISKDLHKLGWKECPWPGNTKYINGT